MVTLDQAGWHRSALVLLSPPPFVSDVIELLWVDERTRQLPTRQGWRVVADDAAHVVYARFSDDAGVERHRLHVVGARTHYADVDCSRRTLTVGARLRPGALPALFRVAAAELTDHSVPAESLVRDDTRETLTQMESSSPRDVVERLVVLLGGLAARGRPLNRRAAALQSPTAPTIREFAHGVGVGERALRAWCTAHLGVGLRRFLRIRRLHAALERRLQHPSATWSAIAAATGYADQPHLVRDFHALLGESPSEFFARAG